MPIASSVQATRLLRLQLGQESTWGSVATATSILHGTAPTPTITPMFKNTQFDEQLGALTPSFRSAQLANGAAWTHSGNVLYEDILYTLAQAFGLPTPALVSPKTITAISKATAAVVTAASHGFVTGQSVLITGSNSSPVIDGVQVVTRIDANSFSVPVNTSAGSTGSAGSVSGTVSYTFIPPVAATFTPASYTMELGNIGDSPADCIRALGCLLNTWSIKGEQQKEMTYTAAGFAKSAAMGTLTPALGFRTVENALTPEVALSLDIAGATPGTTAFASILATFELSGTTGLGAVYAGGSLTPPTFTYAKQDLGLKLGLLYNATLATYLGSNPVAGLPMIVDLKSTSGVKSIEVQYSGVLKSDPVYWGDNQSAQLIELDLGAQYDTALANYAKIIVTNTVVALP